MTKDGGNMDFKTVILIGTIVAGSMSATYAMTDSKIDKAKSEIKETTDLKLEGVKRDIQTLQATMTKQDVKLDKQDDKLDKLVDALVKKK